MKIRSVIVLIVVLTWIIFSSGCLSEVKDVSLAAKGVKIATSGSNVSSIATRNAQGDSYYQNKAESIASAMDYQNPFVHNFALQQISRSHSGDYTIEQICDIWDAIRGKWTYVNDAAGMNYFTPASDTINNGLRGNCVDYAILNAAAIKSIGGSTRVVTVDSTSEPGHAYAEVLIGNSMAGTQPLLNEIGRRYHQKTIHYDLETTQDG